MNRHHRCGHQADRVLCYGADHFLASLAENEVGFALVVRHP
jgi:hypothetical protein